MLLNLRPQLWLLLGIITILGGQEAKAQTIAIPVVLPTVQEPVVKSVESDKVTIPIKVVPASETDNSKQAIPPERTEKSIELTVQPSTFTPDLDTSARSVSDHSSASSLIAEEKPFSSPVEQNTPESKPVKPLTPEEIEQKIEQLQQRLETLDEKVPPAIWMGTPGTGSNVPTAWGGSLGDVGLSANFQERTRTTDTPDGSIGVTVGLGDPINFVGFDVGMTILDLDPFGERGSFTFKLHRVLPEDFAVAVILENSLIWGYSDVDTSVAGIVSKMVRLKEHSSEPFSRLYLSGGIGNGRFRSEDDVIDDVGSVGVFGSATLKVVEPVHLFTEWTGQDLNMGVSILPFRDFLFLITLGASDITGSAGDGVRFTFSFDYGFNF